jgi:RNA polymerase sigma-70 factor (ECF subfamily)
MVDASDSELMGRIGQGDREAFAVLVDRHKHSLTNYLARLTGTLERGEELAQETFLKLFGAAAKYREEGKFLGFLYRIATNLARSDERRERRQRNFALAFFSGGAAALAHPLGWGAPPVNGEKRLLAAEKGQALARALRGLPLQFRVPLVLFAVEGWSHGSIAEFLGCQEGTVKSRIFRGRQRLRRALEPYGIGETT